MPTPFPHSPAAAPPLLRDGADPPEAAVLIGSLRRLTRHWSRVADKLERWAPAASEAYREAARDVEEVIERQAGSVEAWAVLREDLVHAVTSATRRPLLNNSVGEGED